MAFTKLIVGNAALAMLGELPVGAIVEAPAGENKARALHLQFPFALDELLRAFPWNWAKARAELSVATGSPLFEWSNHYALPLDYITLLSINETTLGDPGDWWEIEGGRLLTDLVSNADGTIFIEYIYRPSDEAMDDFLDRMDPLARNALVTLLASKIAPAVTKDGGAKSDSLLARYVRQDLAQARLRTAGESKAPWRSIRTDSASDASRYGAR